MGPGRVVFVLVLGGWNVYCVGVVGYLGGCGAGLGRNVCVVMLACRLVGRYASEEGGRAMDGVRYRETDERASIDWY